MKNVIIYEYVEPSTFLIINLHLPFKMLAFLEYIYIYLSGEEKLFLMFLNACPATVSAQTGVGPSFQYANERVESS